MENSARILCSGERIWLSILPFSLELIAFLSCFTSKQTEVVLCAWYFYYDFLQAVEIYLE